MKIQHYQVEGASHFPIDMLRYDQAWPDSGQDSGLITSPPSSERYIVNLCRNVSSLRDLPNQGRWQSFGWKLINSSIMTY